MTASLPPPEPPDEDPAADERPAGDERPVAGDPAHDPAVPRGRSGPFGVPAPAPDPESVTGPAGSWRITEQPDVRPRDRITELVDGAGPLERADALAILERAALLLEANEPDEAGRHYQRVIGVDDPAITGTGLLGVGNCLSRLDRDDQALAAWIEVTRLPVSRATYPAWRNIAAARVRAGDNRAALDAYRQADRLAPPEDKPEIANRLGWLAKESGDQAAAGRYFARARGEDGGAVTMGIIAFTVVVSLTASLTAMLQNDQALYEWLALVKEDVAAGELWRLWTITLVHARLDQMPLHLLFNMYALYLVGPLVEQMYGRRLFIAIYLACAAGGSIASYAFGNPSVPSVGASGAIFGLFGLVVAAARTHHPAFTRYGRMFVSQIGTLIVINLVLGLVIPNVDNLGHLGGLIAGAWLGVLVPPGRVRTLSSIWRRADGTAVGGAGVIRVVGLLAFAGVLVAGWAMGTANFA